MPIIQTRRRFLTTMSLAGAAGLLHMPPAPAAEEALETPTVRLQKVGLCVAPVYIADDSLRAEGFTDVRYVDTSVLGATGPLASGQVDFATLYASQFVRAFDAGEPLTLLAGVMVGCFELFARESIGSVAQLRGKSIGVQGARSPAQELVTLMAAQVGLDPVKDIHWVGDSSGKAVELFVQGKIDAFLGFPPEPQDLRARAIGHVIVNTAWTDRGRNISAACLQATGNSFETIRSRPSEYYAPSSRRQISAPPNRSALRDNSSVAVALIDTTTPFRR